MLKVTKDFNFYDLIKLADGLDLGLEHEALKLVFDFLDGVYYEGIDETALRDILRYGVDVLEVDEFLKYYEVDVDGYDMEDYSSKLECVKDYIEYRGLLYGFYEDDEQMFVVFDDV